MKEGRLPGRQYAGEFKGEGEAVRLAALVGGHKAVPHLGTPTATLGNWSRRRSVSGDAGVAPADASAHRPVGGLEAENSRLCRELAEVGRNAEILRKDGALRQKVRDEVRAGIDKHRDRYIVSQLCRVLDVSRSG